MKLGIAYNFWDGGELLEDSVKSVRANADFICVVHQEFSNYGNRKDNEDLLHGLVKKGLVDYLHKYEPMIAKPYQNEIEKRNIGLGICSENQCTHFMTMDADEEYDTEQLKKAKEEIEKGDYDSSACRLITYYKARNFRLYPMEDYYVSLIYKIDGRIFNQSKFPVTVDPTRRMTPGKTKIFSPEEIVMHHYSYVRNDIREKLINSTANRNFKDRVEEIARWFDQWEYPQKALIAGVGQRFYDVARV